MLDAQRASGPVIISVSMQTRNNAYLVAYNPQIRLEGCHRAFLNFYEPYSLSVVKHNSEDVLSISSPKTNPLLEFADSTPIKTLEIGALLFRSLASLSSIIPSTRSSS